MSHHLGESPVTKQGHADHQPADHLGGETPLAEAGGASLLQRLLDPRGVETGLKTCKGSVFCQGHAHLPERHAS
jgi:hypothetical protein